MSEDDEHRGAAIGRLFALLTAKLEDGAELAVRGQDPESTGRDFYASEIAILGNDIATIADGLMLILTTESGRS